MISRIWLLVFALAGAASGCGPGPEIVLPDRIVPIDALLSEETGEVMRDGIERATHADVPPEENAPRGNARAFRLAVEAERLARLPRKAYRPIQKRIVGSTFPACNFFLITSLCHAGYCAEGKPFFQATSFDNYFRAQGWKEIAVSELEAWLRIGIDFDAVLQREGARGRLGHVMVPIGVVADGRLRFAQGNHGEATNEIVIRSAEGLIRQRFRVFARF